MSVKFEKHSSRVRVSNAYSILESSRELSFFNIRLIVITYIQ